MWYEFERAAEGAARDRARRAVLNAIGCEEERPPPPRFDEQAHFWFFYGVVPFIAWVAKACSLICVLLAMSIGTYAAIRGLIMRGLDVQSRIIFFDYSPSPGEPMMPTGIVDLRSTRNSPWVHSCADSLDHLLNMHVSMVTMRLPTASEENRTATLARMQFWNRARDISLN